MLDFFTVELVSSSNGLMKIVPVMQTGKPTDLMIKGKAFYAIRDEESGLWSTDERDVQRIVDKELWDFAKKNGYKNGYKVMTMKDFSTGSWTQYRKYVATSPDNAHQLDCKVTFSNTKVEKNDYVSKRLPYPLEKTDYKAYEKIISTLYDPDERAKIEWAIGSIFAGDSIDIQKFLVFYGKAGAGKSTILHIIEQLFQGYCTTFDAKALGSNNNAFSTEVFRSNPLVAIQHDGDLSRIEDNSKLNSIISHEEMTLNEKYKASYTARINCMLFMGTNKEVRITDAKSGILRRLIEVRPSGRLLPVDEYRALLKQIPFELSGIAWHCLEVYKKMGKDYYIGYRPFEMMYKTNAFYNFVENNYDVFSELEGVSLKEAWAMYKSYCEEAALEYKMPMYKFREELKNYFDDFKEVARIDGKQVRSYFSGFKKSEFVYGQEEKSEEKKEPYTWINLRMIDSIFDKEYADFPAQAASANGTPAWPWNYVHTKLRDIDTTKLHYILLPENHIVVDFDLKDEEGNKSLDLNIEAASDFPPTYAEVSKSGQGLHLHYIYTGDVNELARRIEGTDIEVKVFTGKSSLRRQLTKCNDLAIAKINSGLPRKETKKVLNFEAFRTELQLKEEIEKNLRGEGPHAYHAPTISWIYKILEDTYDAGKLTYDLRSDVKREVETYASQSHNQRQKCLKMVSKMHFCSSDIEEQERNQLSVDDYTSDSKPDDDAPIVIFDIETMKAPFVVCFKILDKEPVIKMINPTAADVAKLMQYRLIGFNNKKYDNHIIFGRMSGESNMDCYNRSQRIIIHKDKNSFFKQAYDISYTDVYDFSSKKQSLKKWEIELGIHHKELPYRWDEELTEDKFDEVAEYCANDVRATEAVFKHLQPDWMARQILADIAGLNVNASTNTLTCKIILGNDKQADFVYTDLSEMFPGYQFSQYGLDKELYPKDEKGKPVFKTGKSIYRGEDPSEGGYVYAEPGFYGNVIVEDVESEHPTSIDLLNLFGRHTDNFRELKAARIAIKHKDFDKAKTLFGGRLSKYLKDTTKAKDLSYALKIAINSVYGLTSAKFPNPLRDPRNVDNIVAKRGALFMIDLKHAVQDKGYKVVHIKTDSIKVPDATPEITKFIEDFGKKYGYNFEHESTYEKMCLVNDSTYIAKYSKDEKINGENAGKWTATAAQFQHPYVFKTLFSKEKLEFKDLCETKSVQTALYLDMNEGLPEDQHNYVFVGKVGEFCPIKPGHGGGILLRQQDDKYNAANGSKGYRWLESEFVKENHMEEYIDYSYFDKLADEAKDKINEYVDFEWFASDEPYISVQKYESVMSASNNTDYIDIESDELPF